MAQAGHTRPGNYAIRVQGRLDPRWASWFDGFTVADADDGTSVIVGTGVDQAALHGLLQALRDLALPLLSVTQLEPDVAGDPARSLGEASGRTIPAQEDVP